jgi:hypothetical protein
MPPHEYILDTNIYIDISANIPGNLSKISNTFFNLRALGLEDPSSAALRGYAQKYIQPIFKIKPSETLLVLHCRGGDIFQSNPHPAYVQPPLSYYESIVDNYEAAILIYEDTSNPCVQGLLQNNKITGHKGTLEQDFSILLGAKTIVGCFSTFTYAAYLLSTHLESIYFPDYFVQTLPKAPYDIHFIGIELPNYIKSGEWRNSNEQRSLMITYKI